VNIYKLGKLDSDFLLEKLKAHVNLCLLGTHITTGHGSETMALENKKIDFL
jgi:hypothetical protein